MSLRRPDVQDRRSGFGTADRLVQAALRARDARGPHVGDFPQSVSQLRAWLRAQGRRAPNALPSRRSCVAEQPRPPCRWRVLPMLRPAPRPPWLPDADLPRPWQSNWPVRQTSRPFLVRSSPPPPNAGRRPSLSRPHRPPPARPQLARRDRRWPGSECEPCDGAARLLRPPYLRRACS